MRLLGLRFRVGSRLYKHHLPGTLFSLHLLFAYWLRSSVVSVLFSLITEISGNPECFMIILLFGVRGITSGLLRDSALMAFALHYCKVLSTPFVSSGQRRVVGLMKRIFEVCSTTLRTPWDGEAPWNGWEIEDMG